MITPGASPIVHAITDGLADETNVQQKKNEIVSRARKAAACGVTHFQIREKHLFAARLLELAQAALEAAEGTGLTVLVNGRFDIALAAGAHGVHLPADGPPVTAVRLVVPKGFIIGSSTHSVEEAVNARSAGADYIVFGPVFESPGKIAVGIDLLREACRAAAPMPVLALGGIDENNFREALEAGAAGFAAIRFLNRLLERGHKISI